MLTWVMQLCQHGRYKCTDTVGRYTTERDSYVNMGDRFAILTWDTGTVYHHGRQAYQQQRHRHMNMGVTNVSP